MIKRLALLPLSAALLAACGGGGTGVTSVAPIADTSPTGIRGTVLNYSGGAATIEALALATAPKSASNPVIASAALKADGTFTLPLPSVASLTPYLSAPGTAADGIYTETGCTGSLTDSAPSAQAYTFSTLTAGGQTYSNVAVSSDQAARTLTIDSSLWMYTTLASTLGGNLSCTQTAASGVTQVFRVSANAPLKAGWNVVKLHADGATSVDGRSSTITATFTTGSDQATTWTEIGVSPLSLDPLAARVTNKLRHFAFGPMKF